MRSFVALCTLSGILFSTICRAASDHTYLVKRQEPGNCTDEQKLVILTELVSAVIIDNKTAFSKVPLAPSVTHQLYFNNALMEGGAEGKAAVEKGFSIVPAQDGSIQGLEKFNASVAPNGSVVASWAPLMAKIRGPSDVKEVYEFALSGPCQITNITTWVFFPNFPK